MRMEFPEPQYQEWTVEEPKESKSPSVPEPRTL